MTAAAAIAQVLQADPQLAGLLPGGVYTQEISRQRTPQAFDAYSELKPCATLRAESVAPTGPHERSARLFVLVWFYQQHGYDAVGAARRRVYDLLHRKRFAAGDEAIYEIAHADDLLEAEEPALQVSMERSRYQVVIQR